MSTPTRSHVTSGHRRTLTSSGTRIVGPEGVPVTVGATVAWIIECGAATASRAGEGAAAKKRATPVAARDNQWVRERIRLPGEWGRIILRGLCRPRARRPWWHR